MNIADVVTIKNAMEVQTGDGRYLSRSRIMALVREGVIRSGKIGHMRVVNESDIKNYYAGRRGRKIKNTEGMTETERQRLERRRIYRREYRERKITGGYDNVQL